MTLATPLPLLALAALLALVAAGVLLVAGGTTPQTAAHLALALGVMPLILAAMPYFISVLTRSGSARSAAWWPALMATGGGVLAVYAFAGDFSMASLALAAGSAGIGAVWLAAWTVHRIRNMPGPRHRGSDWYLAALGFLLLGLSAVLLMPLFPEQRNALRLFHLHANLLGFVGLTALGTLQVLLPTCLGQQDPDALRRLRRDLKWAATGTLLIAAGAASHQPGTAGMGVLLLALPGAALYLAVILRMLMSWVSRFGGQLMQPDGAAPALTIAVVGLLGMLVAGSAHAFGWLPARPAIAGFFIAFLLPLVSGAASQLLPTWLRPGAQTSWHRALRIRLCRWGGVRSLLLLVLGLMLTALS